MIIISMIMTKETCDSYGNIDDVNDGCDHGCDGDEKWTEISVQI